MQSNKVILEKEEHIIIYKIVQHYELISRRYLISLARKIFWEFYGTGTDDKPSPDTIANRIREITGCKKIRSIDKIEGSKEEEKERKDTRVKKLLPVLVQNPQGYYSLSPTTIVKVKNEKLAKWVEDYLNVKIKDNNVGNFIRFNHTKRLKEEIISPWIKLLEDDFKWYEEYMNEFKREIKSKPLYVDLKNHIPVKWRNAYNPISIEERIEKNFTEYRKLHKSLLKEIVMGVKRLVSNEEIEFYIDGLSRAIKDHLISERGEISGFIQVTPVYSKGERRYQIEYFVERPVYVIGYSKIGDNKNEILKILNPIFNNSTINDIVEKHMGKLKSLKKQMYEGRKKLLEILKELERYEILPGVCKYMIGGELNYPDYITK
ncbi:hypothetical protein AciM339_1425 [Aciduliprofundum sp. MAR08-339]|uniref:hypothetical protein n=1 Tax=Aciduliprofundum sp. (strain MAR08-339) TaxID=673860 RepID=UPI0002A49326|nr:hypothetical protein AciM339_1425 [Aciduliprofundum sp. MAR08-339]